MNNKPHGILFLNGPAGSGKDTAAAYALRHFGARHYKMAGPLKAMVAALLGLSSEEARQMFEMPEKDQPCALFNGMTPRQVLIGFSERYIKPVFGKDFFGKVAINHLHIPCMAPFTVISDSGFADEALPIVQRFGARNCVLVHLHMDGRTFEGDSRSYIELDKHGVTTVDWYNNLPLDMYEVYVAMHIKKLFGLEPRTPILEK